MNLGKENEKTEFKESLSQLEKGLKSLTAMLNKNNEGVVYFGVDDEGGITNKITIGKDTFSDIQKKAKELIEPQIVLDIEEFNDEEGKKFIRVSAKGEDTPYSFDGRYYIRITNTDERVSNNLLRKLLVNEKFDIITQIKAPRQDLSFNLLTNMLSSKNLHVSENEQLYRNFSLLDSDGQFNLMAYLLADNAGVALTTVRFSGTNKAAMSERKDYNKHCLLYSVIEVLDYISALNTIRVDLSQGKRIETPLFDFEAFREAWLNACLHNSWQEKLSPVVNIFDDRIEVVSYGGLPYKLSEEDFYKGVSIPVNRALMLIFLAAGLTERTGHGIPKIVEAYGKEAFTISDYIVTVTIPFNFEPPFVNKVKIINVDAYLSKNQQNVLEYLDNNYNATLQEVADYTKLSLPGIKKIVAKLQDYGLLERVGSKKTGIWHCLL